MRKQSTVELKYIQQGFQIVQIHNKPTDNELVMNFRSSSNRAEFYSGAVYIQSRFSQSKQTDINQTITKHLKSILRGFRIGKDHNFMTNNEGNTNF